jgi:hypothetical protein
MPARNADVTCASRVWTELTDGDTAALSFSKKGKSPLIFMATTGAQPSASSRDGIEVHGRENGRIVFADAFPGVTGADRLFAFNPGLDPAVVFVSHA